MENTGATTINGRTDPVRLFLSSSGRIGRGPFLLAVAVLLGIFVLYEAVAGSGLHAWTAWAVNLPLLFSAACLLSKRLHDRGRAGWWAAFPVWAFVVAWPSPHGVFGAVASLILVWAVVELGALPGQPEFNRFGPVPN